MIALLQDDGARTGAQGHHRQHGLPGADRHRDPGELPGRPSRRAKSEGAMKRGIPMRRFGEPEDYPGLVAFFRPTTPPTSPARPFSVSGGLTMIYRCEATMADVTKVHRCALDVARRRAAKITINRPENTTPFRGQTLEELIDAFQLRRYRQRFEHRAGRRRRQGVLHRRRPIAHEGHYDGRGAVGLPIDELQGADPRRAQAGDRAGQGLCDRRRQRPCHPLRSDDRIRQGAVRSGRPEGRLGRSRAGAPPSWRALSATRRRARSGTSMIATPREQAREMGLVNKVVPAEELDAAVKDWTDKIAQRSPTAIALAKRSFNADSDNIRGISNFALHAVKMFYDTPESKEGVAPSTKSACRTSTSSHPDPDLRHEPAASAGRSPSRWPPGPKRAKEDNVSRKVIISCAVTGSIHTPSMSPHLPVTATEIAESALAAAEAGAAIVHLHARNPQDGRPDQSPEAFEPFFASSSSDPMSSLTSRPAALPI